MANIEDLAENYGVNDGIDTEDKQPTIQDLASNYSLNPDMQKQLFGDYQIAKKRADAEHALLRDALQKNLINQQPVDKSEMYFKLAAALAAPSSTKGFGEPMMNVANALAESHASERKQHHDDIAKQLASRQALAEMSNDETKNLGSLLARYNVAPKKSQAELFADAISGASPEKQARMREYLTSQYHPPQPTLHEIATENGPQYVTTNEAIGRPAYHPDHDETPVAILDPNTNEPILVKKSEAYGQKPASSSQEKPLTEDQSKANIFAQRMIRSHDIVNKIGDYSPMGVKAQRATEGVPIIGDIVNSQLSSNTQQISNAQRDFITAVNRKESGAVISPFEISEANRLYFPQPGDSDEVIKQKIGNRVTAIKGMREVVPEKHRPKFSEDVNPDKNPDASDRLEQLRKLHGGN